MVLPRTRRRLAAEFVRRVPGEPACRAGCPAHRRRWRSSAPRRGPARDSCTGAAARRRRRVTGRTPGTRDMPQSSSLTAASADTRMFDGRRSPWTTRCSCACWTASHTARTRPTRSAHREAALAAPVVDRRRLRRTRRRDRPCRPRSRRRRSGGECRGDRGAPGCRPGRGAMRRTPGRAHQRPAREGPPADGRCRRRRRPRRRCAPGRGTFRGSRRYVANWPPAFGSGARRSAGVRRVSTPGPRQAARACGRAGPAPVSPATSRLV